MRDAAFVLLLVLNSVVALTAIGGGIALASGAEDRRFSKSMLARTPFTSFRVPGIILAVGVGGSSALAALALLADRSIGGWVSLGAGVVTMVYIAIEGWILNEKPGYTRTEAVYFLAGMLMVGFGFVLTRS